MNNENTIRLLRVLYKNLVGEAIESQVSEDAAEFNRLVAKKAGATAVAAARQGDLDAIGVLCDAAEALVDSAARTDWDELEGYGDPPDEGDLYRKHLRDADLKRALNLR